MIKIEGGTISDHITSTCNTCRNSVIVEGVRQSDGVVHCRALEQNITFPVSQCNSYDDKRLPSRWDMEQIAYVIMEHPKTKKIGFLSPHERQKIEQLGLPSVSD